MARLSQTPLRFTCAYPMQGNKHKDTKAPRHRGRRQSKILDLGFLCVLVPLSLCVVFIAAELYAIYSPGLYALLKLFRPLVTVNVPSCWAETLIQYAAPLCTGAGAAPGPGCGA